jgi:diguanylate cyclase (GGDEF)-like protein
MSKKAKPAATSRRATPRLTAVLALFAISAAVFCALAGYALVRQADDRQAIERRMSLQSALTDVRQAGVDIAKLDADVIHALERTASLKDLRFDSEPADGREIQSVVDAQGRIVGWFSWQVDRSMANALAGIQPLLLATGSCFLIFAGVALWQVRRTVTQLSASEKSAWSLAYEDALTGQPNQRKILERLDHDLATRPADQVVMLAVIDLDRLGDINDAHGHHVGDRLLTEWAARLRAELPERAIGGRFDGDQFAVVMPGTDAVETESVLRAVLRTLARPFWIEGQALQIYATIGVAHAPRDAKGRDELARAADLALRVGKRKARGRITAYQSTMDVELSDRRFLERELKRALTARTLDVHYQPIVTSDGARIVSAEALARWTHPERGHIPPAVFVPVAEQAGLMGELGEFVLRRALADAQRWPELSIAVNLSPVQVRDRQLVDLVSAALTQTGIAPQRLILEVTEGVLVDDPEEAKLRLEALRALGVRLALDDFGTGYSSLSYLRQFRFDKLKIDKSFVAPLARSGDSQAMIQAIVSVGRALDLSLLAEGVETEEQRVLLRLAGCAELQGYLFARPGPREALDALMAEARAAAAKRTAVARAG